MSGALVTSLDVRGKLVEALKLDLVGPWAGHALNEERLPGWVRPSNWYLTGFLIPSGSPPEKSADADENDDFELVPESAGLAEESTPDQKRDDYHGDQPPRAPPGRFGHRSFARGQGLCNPP